MAEFVMKHLVKAAGLDNKIYIESAGTDPSVGTPMSEGTRHELRKQNIAFDSHKTSAQYTVDDYHNFDYIVGLDHENVFAIRQISGGDPKRKIHLLLDFAGENRPVADPWYTHNYAKTYVDVLKGCRALLEVIRREV